MKKFVDLFEQLDRTTSTKLKQLALTDYFRSVDAADGAWAVALLSGRRPKKPISTREIRNALVGYLRINEWLLDEAYESVGDLGETIALLIDTMRVHTVVESRETHSLKEWMETRLPQLSQMDSSQRVILLCSWWDELSYKEILVLQKLIGGGFRVGASETIVIKALADAGSIPIAVVTQRLTGKWAPTPEFFQGLLSPASEQRSDPAQPFPFALAYPLDTPPADLGDVTEWSVEWKWDGIRAQVIRRSGECYIWSRGEDLMTNSFPELAKEAVEFLPDGTVLDGEILVFDGQRPAPFAALQKRIGRKKISANTLATHPVRFLAYDLLEFQGEDVRTLSFADRRRLLTDCIARAKVNSGSRIGISPQVDFATWDELSSLRSLSRAQGVEGLMLKNLSSPYRSGRRRGDWWKWKVDPYTIDAVLIYAQAGSGRRANLFTDYTFGVWNGEQLVTVAKAYSGLDQREIAELDRWIRAHTKEKFGPVRSVEAEQVFELGFEGIQLSGRHKAGVAVRFPRILRWRRDKPAREADSLTTLKALIQTPQQEPTIGEFKC